jgi:hypothetical protein
MGSGEGRGGIAGLGQPEIVIFPFCLKIDAVRSVLVFILVLMIYPVNDNWHKIDT